MNHSAHPGPHRGIQLLDCPFDLQSSRRLRHQVEHCAGETGLAGSALHHFVVAVNEIVSNAVEHGGGQGRLQLWRTADRLYCRVSDGGPGIPADRALPTERPSPLATRGRGLWLARQWTSMLEVVTDGRGTAVTMAAQALLP